MKRKVSMLIVILLLQTFAGYVAAEVSPDPGAALKRSLENLEYFRLEKEVREKKPETENVRDNTGKPPAAPADGQTVQIAVKKLAVDQSVILTAAEIAAITGKYENRTVTIKDLYAAVEELNTLYTAKKYITARAILPPQKVVDGVVRIQLVESTVGKIVLIGNDNTKKSYYFDRISQRTGELVRLDTLDKEISYFNRTNDVQLKAELQRGTVAGTTDLILKAGEPRNLSAMLFADNGGRNETGLYRYGMVVEAKSVFGFRDALTLTPLWARGTFAWSAAYNLPINKQGTRLGFGYDKNQVSIVAGPFESMDVRSRLSDRRVTLSHPLVVKADYKADLFAEVHNKTAANDFFGTVGDSHKLKTTVLGVAFQSVDDKGFWYSRFDITRGDDIKHSEEPDEATRFAKYNVSVVRQQKLPGDRYLIFRLAGQVTGMGHSLPSSEQFALGGMSSVRGYTEGALSGDAGYLASVELNFPVGFSDKVRGVLFFDHGGAFPYRSDSGTNHRDFLNSVGVGATINFSKNTAAKVVVGLPVDPPLPQKHVRIHVFMQSSL